MAGKQKNMESNNNTFFNIDCRVGVACISIVKQKFLVCSFSNTRKMFRAWKNKHSCLVGRFHDTQPNIHGLANSRPLRWSDFASRYGTLSSRLSVMLLACFRDHLKAVKKLFYPLLIIIWLHKKLELLQVENSQLFQWNLTFWKIVNEIKIFVKHFK